MDSSTISMERELRVREKSHNKERAIVVQFLSYKDKTNILRNYQKLKEAKISIFENFSPEAMQIRKEKWKEVLANRKQGKISYLKYGSVICKEGRKPA